MIYLKWHGNIAAFYGLNELDVGDKLTKSLYGMTRGLRDFGIDIDTTTDKFKELVKETEIRLNLDERAAKAYVIYNEALRQSEQFKGAAANSQRSLGVQLDNIKRTLKDGIFAETGKLLSKTLVPALKKINEFLSNDTVKRIAAISISLVSMAGSIGALKVVFTFLKGLSFSGIGTLFTLIPKLFNGLIGLLPKLLSAVTALGAAILTPHGAIITAIVSAIAIGGTLIYNKFKTGEWFNFSKFTPLSDLVESIKGWFSEKEEKPINKKDDFKLIKERLEKLGEVNDEFKTFVGEQDPAIAIKKVYEIQNEYTKIYNEYEQILKKSKDVLRGVSSFEDYLKQKGKITDEDKSYFDFLFGLNDPMIRLQRNLQGPLANKNYKDYLNLQNLNKFETFEEQLLKYRYKIINLSFSKSVKTAKALKEKTFWNFISDWSREAQGGGIMPTELPHDEEVETKFFKKVNLKIQTLFGGFDFNNTMKIFKDSFTESEKNIENSKNLVEKKLKDILPKYGVILDLMDDILNKNVSSFFEDISLKYKYGKISKQEYFQEVHILKETMEQWVDWIKKMDLILDKMPPSAVENFKKRSSSIKGFFEKFAGIEKELLDEAAKAVKELELELVNYINDLSSFKERGISGIQVGTSAAQRFYTSGFGRDNGTGFLSDVLRTSYSKNTNKRDELAKQSYDTLKIINQTLERINSRQAQQKAITI